MKKDEWESITQKIYLQLDTRSHELWQKYLTLIYNNNNNMKRRTSGREIIKRYSIQKNNMVISYFDSVLTRTSFKLCIMRQIAFNPRWYISDIKSPTFPSILFFFCSQHQYMYFWCKCRSDTFGFGMCVCVCVRCQLMRSNSKSWLIKRERILFCFIVSPLTKTFSIIADWLRNIGKVY